MQCFKETNNGILEVDGDDSMAIFSQSHGCLFKLDPRDEQSKLRQKLDELHLTHFKHGGIHFGEGFSVALAFRTTVNARLVDVVTGRLVSEQHLCATAEKNDCVLLCYMMNRERWQRNEDKLRDLYLLAKEKYFCRRA